MTDERSVLDFDHLADSYVGPAAGRMVAWAEVRKQCPIAWNPNHGGFWVVTSHEGVTHVSRENGTYSRKYEEHRADGIDYVGQLGIPRFGFAPKMGIGETDGDYHHALRQALNPYYSPPAVRAIQPCAQSAVDWFLNQHIETGTIDFIKDLTAPVSSIVTLELMGISTAHWREFSDVLHGSLGYRHGSAEFEHAVYVLAPALMEELLFAAKEARESPRDDIVSAVGKIRVEHGRLLDDDELKSILWNLIAGGVDTTAGFTGRCLMHLDQQQSTRQALQADASLIPIATEEFLRLYPSVTSLTRTVTEDASLGGERLHANDRVLVVHAAANTDETMFEDPEEFSLDRRVNRHVTFGLGAHRCIGAHLARLLFQTMLASVLSRLPDYCIHEDSVVEYQGFTGSTGLHSLAASFTPGPLIETSSPV